MHSRSHVNRRLKNAICFVALHPSSLRRTVCTPHSSGLARLASRRSAPVCPRYAVSTGRQGMNPWMLWTSVRSKSRFRVRRKADPRRSPEAMGSEEPWNPVFPCGPPRGTQRGTGGERPLESIRRPAGKPLRCSTNRVCSGGSWDRTSTLWCERSRFGRLFLPGGGKMQVRVGGRDGRSGGNRLRKHGISTPSLGFI